MNRRFESMVRRLERSILALDTPQTSAVNFNGNQRTVSHALKVRELENLIGKLAECKALAKTDSDIEWLNGIGETLKRRVNMVFNAPMLKA